MESFMGMFIKCLLTGIGQALFASDEPKGIDVVAMGHCRVKANDGFQARSSNQSLGSCPE